MISRFGFGVLVPLLMLTSFPNMALAEGSSLHDAFLQQEHKKEEHRKKNPYSKYVLLTLFKDKEGVATGVNIYPGEDPGLFQAAGFKSGDVIMAIDGKPILDASMANKIVEALYQGESIVADIKNGNELRKLSIDFKVLESKIQ